MATETQTIRVVADTSQAERALSGLQKTLVGLVSVGALTTLAQQFIKVSDEATNIQNKMRLVMQEGQTTTEMFNLMAKTAINLGAPLSDVSDLFFRIANNTKDLGLAQTDQLRITELMMKAFMSTGVSVQEASSAVVQFGQALSLGKLQGEEMNAILENAPPIADAIAAKLGVTRGALKEMASQGKISSKIMVDAIKEAGDSIDKNFAQRIPTVTNALNVFKTATTTAFMQFDKATGTSQAFSLAIIKIANAMISVIKFFEDFGAIIVAVAEIFLIGKLYRALKAILTPLLGLGAAASEFGNTLLAWWGALANVQGPFKKLITFFGMLVDTYLPNAVAWGNAFLSVLAGIASFFGIKQLFDAIGNLFSPDQKTATEKYNAEVEKLNKSLGIDGVEASKKNHEATKGLNAEQAKLQGIISKANNERATRFAEIIDQQKESLKLAEFEGAEYDIQNQLLGINKDLHKAIKDDKGVIIGWTAGLSDKEREIVRSLIEQNIQSQALRDLKKATADSQIELNALSEKDLDTRELALAIDKERAKYGSMFNTAMEDEIKKTIQNNQLKAQTLELDKQRALLSGTATPQTKAEQISTVTTVIADYNPALKAAQEYQTKRTAIENAIVEAMMSGDEAAYSNHETLLQARAALDLEYQRQKELMDISFKDRELASAVEHQQALYDLTKKRFENESLLRVQQQTGTQFGYETQKQMAAESAKFEMLSTAEKTQFALEQSASIFNSLGQQNKKAFEAAKAFNIANAVMNTYMGATKALATYPPPFNFIAAAAVVAMGLAQVSAIRSQQYSGRQLGGPVMGGQSYIVGENGPELFTPSTTGSITRNGDLQGGGGTTNVNFTIIANDTTDFDQLLTSRRGLITQMISDAQLEKGRRA